MRKKRRSRGYGRMRKGGAKPNFIPMILVLCLSVACGYAMAKYVVDPAVNYAPQLLEEKKSDKAAEKKETGKDERTKAADAAGNDKASVVEDDVKIEETGQVSGYAVQFGCYSSEEAAETAKASIGIDGLQIIKQNDMYKIVGKVFDTKDKAKEALKALPDGQKAFVTTIYK